MTTTIRYYSIKIMKVINFKTTYFVELYDFFFFTKVGGQATHLFNIHVIITNNFFYINFELMTLHIKTMCLCQTRLKSNSCC